jgi:hypothetical protein
MIDQGDATLPATLKKGKPVWNDGPRPSIDSSHARRERKAPVQGRGSGSRNAPQVKHGAPHMSRIRPVLDREQLAFVQTAATAVPPRWRRLFFANLSDLLTPHPRPSNGDVRDVVGSVVRSLKLGRGVPMV